MSEIRRLLRTDSIGATTVLIDLENGGSYQAVAGSVKVTPGQRRTALTQSGRRYDGGRAVGEALENGTYEWKAIVHGTSVQDALASAEAMVAPFEQPGSDLLLEWRPNGATESNYYEVRGPAVTQYEVNGVQLSGAYSLYLTVQVPVGPLVRHEPVTVEIPATTFPATIALPPIPGTAPALADIAITAAPATVQAFGLLAWTQRPAAPLSGTIAPFGLVDSASFETGFNTTVSDAVYRGGSGSEVNFGFGARSSGSFGFEVDPSTMPADDFSGDDWMLEVWVRHRLSSNLGSLRLFLQVGDEANPSPRYSVEFGGLGRAVVVPSSGTAMRLSRAGSVSLNRAIQAKWRVGLRYQFTSTESGTLGVDYVILVPQRRRACSPTGKVLNVRYPRFFPRSGTGTKTVRSDLSGLYEFGSAIAPTSGIGGSPIELPPGDVDLFFKSSNLVPDDPTASTGSDELSLSGAGTVRITPRSYLFAT